MPQYELMYLLGSHVADTDVQGISDNIQKFVSDLSGSNIVVTQLGKKKLAYPIKKTRNGHYVVVNFTMDTKKINELDAKVRTQDTVVIRYLLINLDEHLERMEKDKIAQSKIVRKIPVEAAGQPEMANVPEMKKKKQKTETAPVLVEINQEELDKKIEEALTEDMTK